MAIFGQRRKDFSPDDMTNNFLLTDAHAAVCLFCFHFTLVIPMLPHANSEYKLSSVSTYAYV